MEGTLIVSKSCKRYETGNSIGLCSVSECTRNLLMNSVQQKENSRVVKVFPLIGLNPAKGMKQDITLACIRCPNVQEIF